MNLIKNLITQSLPAIFASLILLTFVSCDNDDDDCCSPEPGSGYDVWIANEGLFSQGDATLDVFNSDSSTLGYSVFESTNGRMLGDVFQSITFYNNKAYLVINNSQRIEVIDDSGFESIKTITQNIYSPRYAVVVDDQLYVSDISRPFLYQIDPSTDNVVDSIDTGVPVEELVVHNDLIFASANNFSNPLNQVYIIDPAQSTLVDSIEVGLNPNTMILDEDNNLWVMCDGEFGVDDSYGLYVINPDSRLVQRTLSFTSFAPAYPTRLAADGDEVYINGPTGIYKMANSSTAIPSDPFIDFNGTIYALGVHPETGNVYVGDAKDYASLGDVYIFDQTGSELENFQVGYLPARFYFR